MDFIMEFINTSKLYEIYILHIFLYSESLNSVNCCIWEKIQNNQVFNSLSTEYFYHVEIQFYNYYFCAAPQKNLWNKGFRHRSYIRNTMVMCKNKNRIKDFILFCFMLRTVHQKQNAPKAKKWKRKLCCALTIACAAV